MPPKKQQQQSNAPYLPFYILPLFIQSSNKYSQAQKILRSRQINIKKCIDKIKIIQILKQKGLSQHLTPQGQINQQGRKFVCQNIKTVLQQFIAQVTKPVDPKKDGAKSNFTLIIKEDTKKDAKKQEIQTQQNKEPLIELNVNKKCNDFHFYLDFPSVTQELDLLTKNGAKIDIVVVIEEKIKKGSKVPDYNLLSKFYETPELMNNLNHTKIRQDIKNSNSFQREQNIKTVKSILKELRKLKNSNKQFSQMIITEIPFQKDVSHPQNDEWNFINALFNKISQITIQKQEYQNWIKTQVKKAPMIEPMRQIIKKQVPIQTQDKKGKKDASKQPQFQIVQEIIETKYQSISSNIKSDLITYHQIESQRKHNNNSKGLKTLLENLILSVQNQIQNKTNSPQQLQQKLLSKLDFLEKLPLSKLNNIEVLKGNLRKIQPYSKKQLMYNLICPSKPIQQKINFEEIVHKNPKQKQSLQFQYIMDMITSFMHNQEPKLKWNFSERLYRQKLSKQQILSQIQEELLKDPQIYQGFIEKDNINILCLAKINPPGRILYSNDIFEPKTVFNFQNWLKDFKQNQEQKKGLQFYDYNFEDAGNLSIKRQILTPTDNVIICDQKVSFGNQNFKINYFQKDNTIYGLKPIDQQNNEFWLYNRNADTHLSIFEKEYQVKKTSVVTQIQSGGDDKVHTQSIIQSVEKKKRVETWIRNSRYIISSNPYPTIIWLDDGSNNGSRNHIQQIRRQFGPKGQITSYLKDGTIRIFYLNGNTSTFRNKQWVRIVNNEILNNVDDNSNRNKKADIKQYIEGDKIIKIRQDNTIFIQYSNGNTLIIFSDDTKILYKSNEKLYQIKNYNKQINQQITIRFKLPRNKDFAIIGHGSAFAYLGFQNILERSYDGFLYEIWTNQFNTHLYLQKYQYQNVIFQEEIQIIYLQDGSLIKVEENGQIAFVQGDYSHSESKLRHKWNQIFTTPDQHEVGVYDVNLKSGWIKTKDAESNQFKIHIENQNDIHIAVSFKISEEDKVKNQYGNGFHIPELNFFLPAPANSLPPRIFSCNHESQTYYQYLTEDQIKQVELPNYLFHIQQKSLEGKKVRQYSKQIKKSAGLKEENKQLISFSKCPKSKDFEIPSILFGKQTKINMKIQNQPVVFRLIQKIQWNKDFEQIKTIKQQISKSKQLRERQMKVIVV